MFDDAQAEAFFRTLKYRPGYPAKGFKTLASVRGWIVGSRPDSTHVFAHA